MPVNVLFRSIKSWFASVMPSDAKLSIKRLIRKAKHSLMANPRLELTELESILVKRLNISPGDVILVHSSFGSLNANFSPRELICLLKTLVTPAGLIVMPYYPPLPAIKWLERGEIFDQRCTDSSMGILTTLFKNDPEVFISLHPIKAVAAWGKDAEQFVSGHPNSLTPFDSSSPYAKLKALAHAKSIGIGIERCTFFHHCEDTLLSESISSRYLSKKHTGLVRDKRGKTTAVSTLVHDTVVMGARELSCPYFNKHQCPTFINIRVGHSDFYVVSIPEAFDFLSRRWNKSVPGPEPIHTPAPGGESS